MKLLIYILTTGKDVLFESLDSIKKNIQIPHELCVFYHSMDINHPVSLDFYNRITTYTDDVVMATKNQTCPAASGYGKIYKEYDYMLELPDDMIVLPHAIETMLLPYKSIRRVGFVGEGNESHKMKNVYEIDPMGNLPDWGGLLNHEAVNEIGGNGAFFPIYGFDSLEWMQRLHLAQWRIVNYKGLFNHGGKEKKEHESRDALQGIKEIIGESYQKYRICESLGFQNYRWWTDKI